MSKYGDLLILAQGLVNPPRLANQQGSSLDERIIIDTDFLKFINFFAICDAA